MTGYMPSCMGLLRYARNDGLGVIWIARHCKRLPVIASELCERGNLIHRTRTLLNIQFFNEFGVFFYELTAQFGHFAHKNGEYLVGGKRVVHSNLL